MPNRDEAMLSLNIYRQKHHEQYRRKKYKRVITLFLLLGCFAICLGCNHNSKKPEQQQLSAEFYENLLIAFNAHNYPLVRTGLDKINEAGIADKRTLYLEALLALIENSPEKAVTKLQDALVFDPEYGEAHNTLGTIYMRQGKLALAETEFLLASNNPLYQTPEKAYHNLGKLYQIQGKNLQAQSCYNKAITLNQDYFPSHYELSYLYLDTERIELASDEIEMARQISPEHPGVWFQIGKIETARGENEKAISAFRKVIELQPGGNFADRADKELTRIKKSH